MDVLSFRGKGRDLVSTRAKSLRPTARNGSGRAGYAARLVVSVVVLCLATASCGGNATTSTVNPLQVKSCTVQGVLARCGTLAVPEDRLTGHGRQIKIRFVVIPASGPRRAPDPVVYLAGGPGDSAISEIHGQLPGVIGLNQDRDLVFIDQRGTGGSNGLTCPSPPNTLAYKSLVRRTIESCLARLRSQADLRFYTSAVAAWDVAQVLTALGYGQVNLYGVSYGVTAAQVFQRLFPGRVRTMTLISGTLLNIPIYQQIPQASQQALDGVSARCASDPACHDAFPPPSRRMGPAARIARRPAGDPARGAVADRHHDSAGQ